MISINIRGGQGLICINVPRGVAVDNSVLLHRRKAMLRRIAALAALLFAAPACPAPAAEALAAEVLAPEAARQFIVAMGERAVALLGEQGDAARRNQGFAELMVDAIDFDALAAATLGRMARTASGRDKREFAVLFAAHVIDVAIERFGNLQVEKVTTGNLRAMPNGNVMVNTVIDRRADAALSVDWRVHKTPRGPLINDIEVEGYSLAIHYRGEFERVGVSTVPGLIDRLRGMTKDSPALPVVRRKME
jgi:ABC-type transporter MlaC component